METEARENLMKTVPHLLKEVTVKQSNQETDDGLDPINEDEEDNESQIAEQNETEEEEIRGGPHTDQNDEENYEDENDIEDEDSFNPNEKSQKRQPRDSLLDVDDDLSHHQDINFDSNSEVEDNNTVKILQTFKSKKEISAEDEEFMKQFDSILTENIAVSLKILKALIFLFLKPKYDFSNVPKKSSKCQPLIFLCQCI